jgi:hypothetical protein
MAEISETGPALFRQAELIVNVYHRWTFAGARKPTGARFDRGRDGEYPKKSG